MRRPFISQERTIDRSIMVSWSQSLSGERPGELMLLLFPRIEYLNLAAVDAENSASREQVELRIFIGLEVAI